MEKNRKITGFFSKSENYLDNNSIIELRKLIIKDLVGDVNNKKIIDIGCGDGSLSIDFISDNQVTFLDLTIKMLELVKHKIPEEFKKNATIVNSDIINYESIDKYDISICIGVYAHVEDIDLLTLKLLEITKQSGIIIIQYSNSTNLISILNKIKNKLLLRRKYLYKTNNHSTKMIKKTISKSKLYIKYNKSYWPVSPFFLAFKAHTKINVLKYFYKNNFLSKFGSEKVLLLKKL
jgi:2-polyprenyl-3-methyl-5-hydroxy-6-metoxy-1,4-benzoquinol methylase